MRAVFLFVLIVPLAAWADDLTNPPTPQQVINGAPAQPPVYRGENMQPETIPADEKQSQQGPSPGSPEKAPEDDHPAPTPSPDHRFAADYTTEDQPILIGDPQKQAGMLVVAKIRPANDANEDLSDRIVSFVRFEFPRFVDELAWSPDSKFAVMTTADPGGHAPWHWQTFVYSIEDRSLRCLDPISGDVIASDFKFSGPHSVQVKVAPADRDFAHPKVVDVDLAKKFDSMPRIGLRTLGTQADLFP